MVKVFIGLASVDKVLNIVVSDLKIEKKNWVQKPYNSNTIQTKQAKPYISENGKEILVDPE